LLADSRGAPVTAQYLTNARRVEVVLFCKKRSAESDDGFATIGPEVAGFLHNLEPVGSHAEEEKN
jgi:hypothetical protein